MKRLTIAQIKYAEERVNDLLNQLRDKELKAVPETKVLTYSEEEKLRMIHRGKATLINDGRAFYTSSPTAFYTYPENAAMRQNRQIREEEARQRGEIINRYNAEKRRIMDQLVLGDSEAAMVMIEALQLRLAADT